MKREFAWGEFLEARTKLIHYWHNEGISFAEISELVSTDASQIQMIYEATRGQYDL